VPCAAQDRANLLVPRATIPATCDDGNTIILTAASGGFEAGAVLVCFANAFTPSARTQLLVTSTVSNSTTTFADVTGLVVNVATATRYAFDCVLSYTSALAGTAILVSINGPAATNIRYSVETATTATANFYSVQSAYDTALNPATSGAALALPIFIKGTFITTAAGVFAVRFRSEIAGNAVSLLNGSYCFMQ
jgi:hypothetical protein